MKKYILFDNDGVLVETEKWYFEANKKALKLLGLNLEMEFYQNIMVKGGSAFELALLHNIEHDIIEKHRSIRDSFYQEFITTKDISIQNVKDTLKELSKRYKMAIVAIGVVGCGTKNIRYIKNDTLSPPAPKALKKQVGENFSLNVI